MHHQQHGRRDERPRGESVTETRTTRIRFIRISETRSAWFPVSSAAPCLIGGLTRRTLPGLALAAVGAAFLYRGGSGHCMVYESMGLDTHWDPLNTDRSSDHPSKATRLEGSTEESSPLESETEAHPKGEDRQERHRQGCNRLIVSQK